MRIIVVASLAYSLVNFRSSLMSALVSAGHEIIACAPEDDPAITEALSSIGVRYRQIPMQRASLSPWADLVTLFSLVSLLRSERPDIVLAYTQKPIIYGGLAAQIVRTRFFAMVSGLGHVFSDHSGARPALRWMVSCLYRVAIRKARVVFVFNRDDKEAMRRWSIIGADHKVVQVPGSGIDLRRFRQAPVPEGPPVFLLVARLLRNKGLPEFVEAARAVRKRHPGARFQLLGPLDDANPTGIGRAELQGWVDEGTVEYLGKTSDVRPFLASASVFVLPTWYREGLPRTILEAMATGRAIVTTDAPGCRETVEPGENGFLVPARDADALSAALMRFVEDPGLVRRLGQRSRELAERHFTVERVNDLILGTMEVDRAGPPAPGEASETRVGERPIAERA